MSDFRRIYLPYCLKKQPDGRWIVLNRNYKPLGQHTRQWVDYADPHLVNFKGLGPATLAKLSAPGSELTEDTVYLYNDGCMPIDGAAHWDAYQARLRLLAGLQITA